MDIIRRLLKSCRISAMILLCSLILLPGFLSTKTLPVEAAGKSLYQWAPRKTVSILGASISTYDSWIYPEYAAWYPSDTITHSSMTWWRQVIFKTGMKLGTNASYSGSPVSGNKGDDGYSYISHKRIASLALTDEKSGLPVAPDLIFVKGGTNDMFYNRKLGSFTPGQPVNQSDSIDNFAESYDYLLTKIHEVFPNTKIVCLTLTPVYLSKDSTEQYVNALGYSTNDVNRLIVKIAAAHNIPVIDTCKAGLTNQDTEDGTHPNRVGAAKLAASIVKQMRNIPANYTIK